MCEVYIPEMNMNKVMDLYVRLILMMYVLLLSLFISFTLPPILLSSYTFLLGGMGE